MVGSEESFLLAEKIAHSTMSTCMQLIQQGISDISQTLLESNENIIRKCKETDNEFFARILDEIRERNKLFGDLRLFEDPAWNILIDLFVSESRAKSVSITSACIAAGVPASTALRWIAALASAGLVQRQSDNSDARRSLLKLSDKGKALLGTYYERCARNSAQPLKRFAG